MQVHAVLQTTKPGSYAKCIFLHGLAGFACFTAYLDDFAVRYFYRLLGSGGGARPVTQDGAMR